MELAAIDGGGGAGAGLDGTAVDDHGEFCICKGDEMRWVAIN